MTAVLVIGSHTPSSRSWSPSLDHQKNFLRCHCRLVASELRLHQEPWTPWCSQSPSLSCLPLSPSTGTSASFCLVMPFQCKVAMGVGLNPLAHTCLSPYTNQAPQPQTARKASFLHTNLWAVPDWILCCHNLQVSHHTTGSSFAYCIPWTSWYQKMRVVTAEIQQLNSHLHTLQRREHKTSQFRHWRMLSYKDLVYQITKALDPPYQAARARNLRQNL